MQMLIFCVGGGDFLFSSLFVFLFQKKVVTLSAVKMWLITRGVF